MSLAKSTKLLSLLVLACSSLASAWAAPLPVGRIALSVGDAKRVDPAGRATPLRAGSSIVEGDRIITGGDAIAIIVFIDEGRISLRSDSELLVRQYKVDPAGQQSRLDFELVRGSVRQISGQAAKAQPEQYRLNTPVASIGVRGTDFLAKASSESIETFVHEGAIVLLPGSASCAGAPQAGACAPLANLAATDANRYLKLLVGGEVERRTMGADDIDRVFGINLVKSTPRDTVPQAVAAAPVGRGGEGVLVADTKTAPKDALTDADKLRNNPDLNLNELVAAAQRPGASAGTPGTPTVPVVAPPAPLQLNNTPDLSRQLVWGAFTSAETLPLELLVPYAEAKVGRKVTVGDLGQFALWRNGDTSTMPKGLAGTVQFDIHGAQAFLQREAEKLPVAVSAPSLSVDFDRSQFDTSLTLTNSLTGSVTLRASGKLSDEGIFVQASQGQRVAGAVSLNGKEAGYWFSKDSASGVFKGVTLWNVR